MSDLEQFDTENFHYEYKRCLNDRFEPAFIAFLNASGGNIYIGIDDDLTGWKLSPMAGLLTE